MRVVFPPVAFLDSFPEGAVVSRVRQAANEPASGSFQWSCNVCHAEHQPEARVLMLRQHDILRETDALAHTNCEAQARKKSRCHSFPRLRFGLVRITPLALKAQHQNSRFGLVWHKYWNTPDLAHMATNPTRDYTSIPCRRSLVNRRCRDWLAHRQSPSVGGRRRNSLPLAAVAAAAKRVAFTLGARQVPIGLFLAAGARQNRDGWCSRFMIWLR